MLNLNTFTALENWILNSGLMIDNYTTPNFGGVHSFYHEKDQKYGFIYPEITGYYISCMRFLHHITHEEKYIQKAEASALWLIQLEDQYGGIIQGIKSDNKNEKLCYSFDTGICVKGLLDCYNLSEKKEYLEIAQKLGNWIIDEAIDLDGTIKPLKNLKNNKFEIDKNSWYKQKGCLHIKTSMPLFQLHEITKIPLFLEKAILICDSFKKFQRKDGSLSLHPDNSLVHLHSLCYALEGLFFAYSYTKNDEYLNCCIRALNWCTEHIQNDNSIELWFNSKFQHSKTSYAISQLIRLLILKDKVLQDDQSINDIKKLNSFLQTLQANSSNKKIDGGYYEEYYKSLFGWKKRKRVNSWGSMFALQSTYWIENYKNLKFSESINYLF